MCKHLPDFLRHNCVCWVWWSLWYTVWITTMTIVYGCSLKPSLQLNQRYLHKVFISWSLRIIQNLQHHFQSLKGWTFALEPYWSENTTSLYGHPNFPLLVQVSDPFCKFQVIAQNNLGLEMKNLKIKTTAKKKMYLSIGQAQQRKINVCDCLAYWENLYYLISFIWNVKWQEKLILICIKR